MNGIYQHLIRIYYFDLFKLQQIEIPSIDSSGVKISPMAPNHILKIRKTLKKQPLQGVAAA